jgi:Fe2+ or Zn2+ uptake regulation protein
MRARLRVAGYSDTRPRRRVIELLAQADGALTPNDIRDQAQAGGIAIGLVTIYRTLDILAALGLVRKVHLPDGCHAYAVAACAHGHHVVCLRCQQVVEFEGCDLDLEAMVARVRRQTGYRVDDHWLELLGLCPACQAAEAAQMPEAAQTPGIAQGIAVADGGDSQDADSP